MNISNATKVKTLNNTAAVLSYGSLALVVTKRIKTAGVLAVTGQLLFLAADSIANDDLLDQLRAANASVSNLATNLAAQHGQ